MELFTLFILVLDATFRVATPLVLAALAGMFSERAGVVDIGLEGKMLGAAFAAATVAAVTGDAWLGLGAGILALTPISAFRPRRWRGALLPHEATVTFTVLEAEKRAVSAVADNTEVRDVLEVTVREDRETTFKLLFDPEHNLEERILKEQFTP